MPEGVGERRDLDDLHRVWGGRLVQHLHVLDLDNPHRLDVEVLVAHVEELRRFDIIAATKSSSEAKTKIIYLILR